MRLRALRSHAHILPFRRADWDSAHINVMQAPCIHSEMIGGGAFIVKDICAADAAEIMPGDVHIPLVERQLIFAGYNL